MFAHKQPSSNAHIEPADSPSVEAALARLVRTLARQAAREAFAAAGEVVTTRPDGGPATGAAGTDCQSNEVVA
jgi:hypothetical protein